MKIKGVRGDVVKTTRPMPLRLRIEPTTFCNSICGCHKILSKLKEHIYKMVNIYETLKDGINVRYEQVGVFLGDAATL